MRMILFTAALFAGLLFSGCGGNQTKKQADNNEGTKTENDTKTMEEKTLTDVEILIETSEGNIKVKLYDETPIHRDNFVKLVQNKSFDGVIFHRVINNFMIQGGNLETKPNPEKIDYTLKAEIKPELFIHKKGALAAARLGDNINPEFESSGSQFYIVQGQKYSSENQMQNNAGYNYTPEQIEVYKTIGGTPFLDGSYTVFGEVLEGLDIVDKIATTKTLPGDRPEKDIVIQKMTIIE